MAKTSKVVKNEERKILVARHAEKRAALKATIVSMTATPEEKDAAGRALRKMPGGQAPKVVFCTTENDVACIARAMHAGADEYVMKPFDRETMTSKLQEVGIV